MLREHPRVHDRAAPRLRAAPAGLGAIRPVRPLAHDALDELAVDDEVLRRRPGHALEDLEERPGGVRALWALRLRANRP